MSSSSAKPVGIWRALQLLLSPFAFAAKAAVAVTLILAVIAVGLIWAVDAMIPRARQRPELPFEVRRLVTHLSSLSPFRALATNPQCKRASLPLFAPDRPSESPTDSCTYVVGRTSVRIDWNKENGWVWRVTLTTSIPNNELAGYRSAPLGWLDFPEIHRIFCPRGADPAGVMVSLPQRLAQTPWVRRDAGKDVPADPDKNARRSVDVDCGMSLTEIRGRDQLQVTLQYPMYGQNF